jgi:hypothetical protein
MSKLNAAGVRRMLDDLDTINVLIMAMRKEVRIPTYNEVYDASSALDHIRDAILKAAVVEIEVDMPTLRKHRTAPPPEAAQTPASSPETQATGEDPNPPVADPAPAATPLPVAAATPAPEVGQPLASTSGGPGNGHVEPIDAFDTSWEIDEAGSLFEPPAPAAESPEQHMALAKAERLMLRVRACRTRAEAAALSKDIDLITDMRWLRDNAPLIRSSTASAMDDYVKGLP